MMALTLVLGPANSAKAGEVLGACAAAADHDAMLVVPTWQDVEWYGRELAARGAVMGGAVATFKGLVEEIGRRTGYRPARVSALQRDRILRRALVRVDLKVTKRSVDARGFPNSAWRLISELERSLITPERFDSALRAWAARDPRRRDYARDLAALYEGYGRELQRHGRVDGELFAWRAVDALMSSPQAWGTAPVFVYGFDDLTPAELYAIQTLAGPVGTPVTVSLTWEPERAALAARGDAVDALRAQATRVIELPAVAQHYAPVARRALHHLERHLFEPDPVRRLDPVGAIRLLEAGGERAEVELVAAEVLALLRGGMPAREIAVVYRSLRRTGALVERIFEEFGIPIAVQREVRFVHTPLGRGLLALARCSFHDRSQATAGDLLCYLRTPGLLSRPEIADRVEATVRREGLRSAEEAIAQSGLRFAEVEVLRRAARPVEELGRQARRLFASHRRGLAPVLDHREELDARALAVLMRSLAELADLGETVGGGELIDVLEELTVPLTGAGSADAVVIAEPLEIRARRFRAVFICGLQENEFPRPGGADPFLPDELRRELGALGLPLRRRDDALEQERYLFYACVSRPTEQVVLSYRSSDEEGNIELPSPFIEDVAELLDEGWMERRRRRLLDEVVWPSGEAPTARERARAEAAASPDSAELMLYRLGETARGHVRHCELVSAGALEHYADCPMKWLVERELQPEPFGPLNDVLVRGGVVHRVLEELLGRLGGRVTEDALPEARRIVASLLREHAAAVGVGGPEAVRAGLVRAIEADIERFLTVEASSSAEWPAREIERRFGFEDEDPESLPALELPGGVRVRGVIDRVDIEPGGTDRIRGAVVRDYKTGGTKPEFQGARWEADRSLQVPLYMLAVRELLGLDPVAGFYQPLGGDDLRPRGAFREGAPVGDEVVVNDARTHEELQVILEAARERAVALGLALRAGELPPQPGTCSRFGCAYPGICRAA
jgi:ATP-dependent helicase/DNAse subunit B